MLARKASREIQEEIQPITATTTTKTAATVATPTSGTLEQKTTKTLIQTDGYLPNSHGHDKETQLKWGGLDACKPNVLPVVYLVTFEHTKTGRQRPGYGGLVGRREAGTKLAAGRGQAEGGRECRCGVSNHRKQDTENRQRQTSHGKRGDRGNELPPVPNETYPTDKKCGLSNSCYLFTSTHSLNSAGGT